MVVPCRGAGDTLGDLLEALAGQRWDGDWEVVLADNGSRDASLAVAERYRGRLPGFRVVDASDIVGVAHARNRGVEAARGRSVAFVDADDVPARSWLSAVGNALRRHRFVASRLEYGELNPPFAGAIRGRTQSEGLQELWYPPCRDHAAGSGLGIRRSLYRDVGGCRVEFLRLSDTDLCIRVQERGVPLRFAGDAVIHKRCRSGVRESFRQARGWARYNELVYACHRPDGDVLPGAWRRYLRGWSSVLGLLSDWRRLRSEARRENLAWQAGWQVGMLEGAVRYGVPPVAQELT